MSVKTTVHVYRFDIGSERYGNTQKQTAERTAYRELREKLAGMGLRCMTTNGGFDDTARKYRDAVRALDGREIEIETAALFDDQVNTAPIPGVSESGLRLFDWREEVYPNEDIKEGQWLEQSESLQAARHGILKCGYCGKHEPVSSGLNFCPHCLDSEYLKVEELHLTRLQRVSEGRLRRAPLTTEEEAELHPRYVQAQIHGSTERGRARVKRERESIEKEYHAATMGAATKRNGLLWLMDRGFNTGNVIYYPHTDTFAFGWRKALSDEELSGWLDVMVEFPFRYTLVGVNRKCGRVSVFSRNC
jgi:hypothetical protein